MKNIKVSLDKIAISEDNFVLIHDDSFNALKEIDDLSVDMIFADPPYFLSNDGVTCKSGKMVSVNKAKWDKGLSVKDKLEYNRKWLKLCRRILSDDGTIWVSGTLHNIYSVGVALELEGFDIINNITWEKPNPPPNLGCRSFTHSTETLLWARKKFDNKKKGAHIFNYSEMKEINNNKQMKDVWSFVGASKTEKTEGKHPTQKPISLIERIILASTNEGDLVLDPFSGSGTTGIAAATLQRKYIGIEIVDDYIEITKRRYKLIKGVNNYE